MRGSAGRTGVIMIKLLDVLRTYYLHICWDDKFDAAMLTVDLFGFLYYLQMVTDIVIYSTGVLISLPFHIIYPFFHILLSAYNMCCEIVYCVIVLIYIL